MLEVLAAAIAAPGFVGCKSFFAPEAKAVRRPAAIVFACGDGNCYATGLRWSRRTSAAATASGVGLQLEFTCVSWRFPAARPRAVARSGQRVVPLRLT